MHLRPVCCTTLAFAILSVPAARAPAGAVIELIPEDPGPYFGGETVEVDVYVTSSLDHNLRLLQFDFTGTDAALSLEERFDFTPHGADGIILDICCPNLEFTSLVDGDGAVVSFVYVGFVDLGGGFMLDLAADVPVNVGNIDVTLPADPGTYLLDAATADDPDPNRGARIDFDFYSPTTWRAYTGELTGGTYEFHVIPEPSSAAIALLGAAVMAGLRYGARRVIDVA